MTKKVGTYYFSRHRSQWGIYLVTLVTATTMEADHIEDVVTYEQAVRETYRLNGWGTPKNIVRKY